VVSLELDDAEMRVLRSLAGGRKALPIRDSSTGQRLVELGLVTSAQQHRGDEAYDLSPAGVEVLVAADGPLTAAEREAWLSWPKTRFGKDGAPQKLLRGGWKVFTVPRARALLERWRRYGIRQSG
jgi:hypothetical protein